MVSGLAISVRKGASAETTEHVFDRLPVLVGRDASVVGLCLADPSVSRVHARLDIRDGAIWVRDARSTNGTIYQGARISQDGWSRLGDATQPYDLEVGIFRLQLRPFDVELRAMTETGSAGIDLATLFRSGEVAEMRRAVGPQQRDDAAPEAAEITRAEKQWEEARQVLLGKLRAVLQPLSGSRKAQSAEAILQRNPQLAEDSQMARFLGEAMGRPVAQSSAGEADVAALGAIQELASWYLGPSFVPTEGSAVRAFKDKLRAALDEFMLGYVPLLGSVSKLARELALETAPADALKQPASPAEFARRLLDWRDSSDEASKSIRESFSEVIVHQAGMLNGIMRGVQALLGELAPETIEAAMDRSETRPGLLGRAFGGRERELWVLFKSRYADLADEEQERFRILFGKEFAEEYLQFTGETRAHDGTRRDNQG